MKPRKIRIDGDVAYVPLTKGYEAVIDAADVPLVQACAWSALVKTRSDGTIRAVYAIRARRSAGGCQVQRWMHRVILGTPDGFETDHIDGNGLNNRRCNLRQATNAQNQHNRRLQANNTSGTKGVHWCKKREKWRAGIVIAGRKKQIGSFPTIEEAAAAYAAASAELHADFGRLF